MPSTEAYNILGLVGSFMISASLLPQIHKVIRTKSATDISRAFQLLYTGGVGLLMVYGIGESLWPIYIPASLELVCGVVLLYLKWFYERRGQQQQAELLTSPHAAPASDAYHSA